MAAHSVHRATHLLWIRSLLEVNWVLCIPSTHKNTQQHGSTPPTPPSIHWQYLGLGFSVGIWGVLPRWALSRFSKFSRLDADVIDTLTVFTFHRCNSEIIISSLVCNC